MDTTPATQSSAPAQGEVAESPSQVFTPAPVVSNPVSVPAASADDTIGLTQANELKAADAQPSAGANFGGVNILPPPPKSEPVEDAYSDSSSSSEPYSPPTATAENLPYFQSHKVVQAGKIKAIEKAGPDAMEVLALDNGTQIGVDDGWLDKHLPDDLRDEAGDDLGYFIRYADGYTSWSPTKAFEEGYSPVDQIPDGKNLSSGLQAQGQGYSPSADGGKNLSVDGDEARPGPFTRLVAALVACINTHCNSAGKDVADTKVAQFKAARSGGTTDSHEYDRLDKVFKHLQEQPAPVNPIADLPEPPAYVPPSKDEQAIVAE